MEKNLTTGSVFKTILYFALPYLFSYFLQTLYGMADLFIIGQFNGTESTTAVANGSQVMHMLTVMIVGLAMGSTVIIGRAVGARHKDEIAKTVGNSVTLFMGLSIVLTIVLLLLVRPIVLLIQTPVEAIEGSIRYLTICFIGIPFITAYNIIASICRGMGDSKSPMYFIAIACAANIALDYVFMGVLHLGARSRTWHDTRPDVKCYYLIAHDKETEAWHQTLQTGFHPKSCCARRDLKDRYSGCDSGWLYPDCIYHYHSYSKQPWLK